jgi:hypothetical protein
LFVVAATLLLLAGCESTIGQIANHQPPQLHKNQTRAGVQEAVYKRLVDYQAGDTDAMFSDLTKACRLAVGRSKFSKEIKFDVLVTEGLSGSKASELQLREVSVVEFTAEQAEVKSSFSLADGTPLDEPEESEAIAYEDGRWKFGNCFQRP